MEQRPEVPQVYILNRNLDPEAAETNDIVRIIRITPIYCIVVLELVDLPFAQLIDESIVRITDPEPAAIEVAKEWAEQVGQPVLVLGTAEKLDAIYADGTREAIC